MMPFPIDRREAAFVVAVFVVVMIGFGVLSSAIHWPNEREGWPLAVAVAALVALSRLIPRAILLLQQSGVDSLTLPGGFKFDFSAAAEIATVSSATLAENLVQPGVTINETSYTQLIEAVQKANEQSVVVIDFKDGRAWYKTRLFALAATAEILHAPRAMVLVGQRGGQPLQVAGWVRPRDLVKAVIWSDPRYEEVRQHAQNYLHRLQSQTTEVDLRFPKLQNYQNAFKELGSASILLIMFLEMQRPDSPTPAPLEDPNGPPWITLRDAEDMLEPWLVRDLLDRGKPDNEQVNAVITAKGDIVVATREGQYAGVIDVAGAERELLRQLLVRTEPGRERKSI